MYIGIAQLTLEQNVASQAHVLHQKEGDNLKNKDIKQLVYFLHTKRW